ncbi:putative Aminotransferase [Taphrina deformans PYCC 5710]|uniref:Aminotransferase n=1 Tax=Taphrina deformans (strain PYCC 5710 / ATCC 11124 / CBS 356.35 / IMI 108563 / JCM 9778 / NBRC 8474) TaxID=1097556 RepID=R4XB58_TAPDE|nr:putative Aminotransferase [Taphrina deformans PYCC 5710]|eukprot:CCG80548.1 putative Aminotransferase [Taphrina deformans PYCC 5710]
MDSQLAAVYATLTLFLLIPSIWHLQKSASSQKKEHAITYTYGAVREYPKATWYQIAQEVFFMAYYYCVARFKAGLRGFDTVLAGEQIVQTFLIPGISQRPRVVLTPLRAHGKALTIDWMGDWQKAKGTTEVINAASFDYGGFGLLLHNASDVLAATLKHLPYMETEGTELITAEAAKGASKFLGFKHCHFVTSGYTMNLIAFPAMHAAATARGHSTVFLMDGSSHNSMMIGSYISTGSKIMRWQHNNLDDLEKKLVEIRQSADVDIIVGLEGNYSMEGGLPPLPAIIALKRKYDFKIYIDEAHSFLALGCNGKGIVEHYQDLGHVISSKDVDCIGATMSKSVGTIGGMLVVHDDALSDAIKERLDEYHSTGGSGDLATVVKMRLLQIMRKPLLVRKRMAILRQHTIYILESLHKAGLCVHSDYMSPVIVVITVSLSGCARFGAECHRLGLAVTMAGPPATDAWRSVGRLCINALLTKEDVEQLVRIVVQAAVNIGNVSPRASVLAKTFEYNFTDVNILDGMIEKESNATDATLLQLVEAQRSMNADRAVQMLPADVLDHGVEILRTQGLGATSNRLFWGSLLAHVRCEERLSTMFPSLAQQVGEPGSLIMTEARNTVSSTVATCIGPLHDKGALHLVLVPESAGKSVREAIKSMKKSKAVQVTFYHARADLANLIDRATEGRRVHVTVYAATYGGPSSERALDLASLVTALTSAASWRGRVKGLQVLLDDTYGFGRRGPRRLGFLDALEAREGTGYLASTLAVARKPTRVFVMGSFYESFGVQGGFVLTSKQLVKILHWTSRASMFATAPLPCNVGMAHMMIDKLCLSTPGQPAKATIEVPTVSLEEQVERLGIPGL